MKLRVIGCYAATPRYQTHPSAQVLETGGHLLLIDCGEGTQMELRRYRIRLARIDHIFISHLHGDHFFGLPGLIATFQLLGRERPLHIYGPKGIREAISLLLRVGETRTRFALEFRELTSPQPETILANEKLEVSTLPLNHRIYANGFLIQRKPGMRKLRAGVAESLGVDKAYYRKIKQGADGVAADGRTIPNHRLTEPPPPAASYAYCSDTAYKPELAAWIRGVDTLYHESTFLETEARLAAETGHSTALQAARIARDAGVGRLILGHYSTRYRDLEAFRQEALGQFPNVELAEDGKAFEWSAGQD
ncbi:MULTISPECIES: ribonuclease Z [unclassified Robiginitalea]|uniref:ribonuclease Z n=1 Tax=Robiginitalea TaxID=252306 RepID=UPI0023492A86|nr:MULTISPECIES: ribonuclease Z [unclassified Robiginitalea]MDC6353706.1 ribonuclease Z [Robiginitalea sp. PM2]MDC6375780.1 ribonuclease Z [Robiginitalea sp. SP8]